MDLPTEIWIHILSEFFASYSMREKLWLQNVDAFLRGTEEDEFTDLDLQPASIYERQKEVYYMAFQFTVYNKQFAAIMQSRQIWKSIFACTVGTYDWRRRVPQEFEVRLQSDYLAACTFLRTFQFHSHLKYALSDNALQHYMPDFTKETNPSCTRCQERVPHEHWVKFNARTQKLVEFENWPDFNDQIQVINAERKFLVISRLEEIVLFDIEHDCVVCKFSTEMLPRKYHLFFINLYKKKLVFAVQGLGYYLRTLILDLDKGLCITDDDISTYKHWPQTPYYVSSILSGDLVKFKILNDDNSFTTIQFEADPTDQTILRTDNPCTTYFIDNRMIVNVKDEGVYEVNPLTRRIIYTFPIPSLSDNSIFLSTFSLSVRMDPSQDYTTATLRDVYDNKILGSFRFRNSLTDWNALLNGEPLAEPSLQFVQTEENKVKV